MASTRHSNEIFLIGIYQTNPLIALNQLTTNRKVLQRFQQHMKKVTSVRNASHSTIDELYLLWSKATITTFSSDDYRSLISTSQHENLTAEKIKMKLQLINADVASAQDRNKTSDLEAVRLMIPMAAALGHDPAKLPLFQSTIERARKRTRRDVTDSVRSYFEPSYTLIVHWDGKTLPKMLGGIDVERLPVVVFRDGNEKLLGVPKISAGTGDNKVNAVYCLLQEWKLIEKVLTMSFDTTSFNSCRHTGVCKRLEDKLGRKHQWLSCRHHILKLILAKVFSLCFEPSNSLEIHLFKRFNSFGSRDH